jgi:hypothetical protein
MENSRSFSLYGPDKSFFDKKWVLPDIEKIRRSQRGVNDESTN